MASLFYLRLRRRIRAIHYLGMKSNSSPGAKLVSSAAHPPTARFPVPVCGEATPSGD